MSGPGDGSEDDDQRGRLPTVDHPAGRSATVDHPAGRSATVDERISEAEIETNALSGREMDAILREARPRTMSLDGVTAEVAGDEMALLLARSRVPVPAPRAPEPAPSDDPGRRGAPIVEEVSVDVDDALPPADGGLLEAAPEDLVSTRRAPIAPVVLEAIPQELITTRRVEASIGPPRVSLAQIAPPVAVPRLPSTPPEPLEAPPPSVREAPPPRPPRRPVSTPAPPPSAPPPAPATRASQHLTPLRSPRVVFDAPASPPRAPRVALILLAAGGAGAVAFGLVQMATPGDEEAPKPVVAAAPAPRRTLPTPPDARAPMLLAHEREAKEALGRLRDGLPGCVRITGVLPGNSPPVPPTLKAVGAQGYASTPADWRTPVWNCASFHLEGPKHAQVQWQLAKSGEGQGIAWIDDDGDGRADRAFGFRASLKSRGVVQVGAIEAIAPTTSVTAVAY